MIRTWIVIVVSVALMFLGGVMTFKNKYPWSVFLGLIVALIGVFIMFYNVGILFIS